MIPRALIVDDSITVRMDLKEALDEAGFSTTLCPTLASAREMISKMSFDVILLDIHLPDGDGFDFLKELKSELKYGSHGKDARVMLLASISDVGERIRGLQIGADEYLGKPYNRAYVVSRALELSK